MYITRFQFIPYQLKTTRPLQLSRYTLRIKKGYLLQATLAHSSKTCKLVAEVPAIPTIHPFTAKKARHQIGHILNTLKNRTLPEKARWTKPGFGILPLKYPLPPAQILFTLESLLLGIYHRQFLADFKLSPSFKVPINTLWMPEQPINTPLQTVKIKLQNVKNPWFQIQKLLKQHPHAKLRLDPCRSMTPGEIQTLIKSIPKKNLEYIEDPYPNLHKGLAQFSRFPLALDKELQAALKNKKITKNTVALVIKPSRDLALSGAIRLIRQKKFKIVISSPYDTVAGLWSLAHLGKISQTASGLDVQKVFQPPPALPPHPIRQNQLYMTKNYQKKIDKSP